MTCPSCLTELEDGECSTPDCSARLIAEADAMRRSLADALMVLTGSQRPVQASRTPRRYATMGKGVDGA